MKHENKNVFISVGSVYNERQEKFVSAIEQKLLAEDIIPKTVGRNTFSSDSPLKAVSEIMNNCSGAMVIALERKYFPEGKDKPNSPQEKQTKETKLSTPWNQIEATMAYVKGLPLFIVVENGVDQEGLLERGYDWYTLCTEISIESINSKEFNGIFKDWLEKVRKHQSILPPKNISEMPMKELLLTLKPAQIWSAAAAILTAVGGAFALGAKFFK